MIWMKPVAAALALGAATLFAPCDEKKQACSAEKNGFTFKTTDGDGFAFKTTDGAAYAWSTKDGKPVKWVTKNGGSGLEWITENGSENTQVFIVKDGSVQTLGSGDGENVFVVKGGDGERHVVVLDGKNKNMAWSPCCALLLLGSSLRTGSWSDGQPCWH